MTTGGQTCKPRNVPITSNPCSAAVPMTRRCPPYPSLEHLGFHCNGLLQQAGERKTRFTPERVSLPKDRGGGLNDARTTQHAMPAAGELCQGPDTAKVESHGYTCPYIQVRKIRTEAVGLQMRDYSRDWRRRRAGQGGGGAGAESSRRYLLSSSPCL